MDTNHRHSELGTVRQITCVSWAIFSIALFLPLALAAQTYDVLHYFASPSATSPAYSYSALVQDSSGNFYGTSTQGGNGPGSNGLGTIYKLETDGTLTILHSFQGSDGATPYAGLIRDDSGNLYGTTSIGGGPNGTSYGTVFELDPSGTLTTLHVFSPFEQGATLRGSLIRDEAGNLYGTTTFGGLAPFGGHYGIVFKLDPSGAMTTLHTFSYVDGGVYPRAGLIRDVAGNLYGTTSGASEEPNGTGQNSCCPGAIFRIDAAGTLTTLHSFNHIEGAFPLSALIRDDSGNLYGTTTEGGSSNLGTIFRLDSSGVLTTLYEFHGPDGANPTAALVRDDVGNLYGTTANGGDVDGGTVFRLDNLGNMTTLHSFNVAPLEGVHPRAPLIRDASGNLVGTTVFGGTADTGVIFRVNVQVTEHVTIDIKPGSDSNPINPGSAGKVPVAILGTEAFDVSTVNAALVRFGVHGAQAAPVMFALDDVNDDGLPDLVLHFNIPETGIRCGDDAVPLTGITLDGRSIEGSDHIQTVGCK